MQNIYERRTKFPLKYLETRILRICWRNFKIFRILQMMRKKLGPVCGVNKLYLQRGLAAWINAWKKRNKISYACHLLQNSIDRFTVRRALYVWPGWREYRKSEEMKMRLLVEKRGRGRLLGIVGFAEGAREREKKYKREESDNISHFALSSSTSSFIRQKKERLSLAERIAIESTYLICDDHHKYRAIQNQNTLPLCRRDITQLQLQHEAEFGPVVNFYKSALSLATSLLSHRMGGYVSNQQNIGVTINNNNRNLNMEDCNNANDFRTDNSSINGCAKSDNSNIKINKNSRNCNRNIDSNDIINDNNDNSEQSQSEINVYSDQSERTIDLLFESLISSDKENKFKYKNKNVRMEDPRSTVTVNNRIVQAVKEILVLLRIVIYAWKRATQSLISRRIKGRKLCYIVDKVKLI